MESPPARPAHPGFTLVEILIVVVILGILAAIVVPRFAGATDEAKMGAFIASLKTYADACEYFAVKEGFYPPDGGSGEIPAGFEDYVDQSEYESPTPVGGVWDIEYNEMGVTSAVGVHFIGEPVPGYMLQIDERFDDGDLEGGLFQEIAGDRFYYIIAF
ncbi:MAG: prepilin-type N-terminal cleavage/methylation domain-containing protein [Phycisphaerales bacterium]